MRAELVDTATVKSRKHHHRSKWAHCNTPEALRRRRAAADAKREAIAATLPPAVTGPEPGTHWQRIVIDLYVPTQGRCDQHATMIDGQRVGLLSATQIATLIRDRVRKRPSVALIADIRREEWMAAG